MRFRYGKGLILVGAMVLAAMVTVAGTALAQTPAPTPAKPKANYQETFLDRLAASLGVTRDKLSGAFTQARNDTVDQAVKDGKLTQQQADKLKARKGAGPGFTYHGFPWNGGKPAPIALGQSLLRDVAAQVLGMTPQDLATQLRSGKTLKQLVQEQGKEQQVRDALLQAAKKQLDQAVANGRLTQDRANQAYDKLQKSDLLSLFGGPRVGAKPTPKSGNSPSLRHPPLQRGSL